ncbi:MAG: nitroreductase family deazaflavin-dependent oxidoreductase [Dehalococcoidia bacterium]|nr:nitroreductase family deazaflavin-dependent oxidoreductase [Dehalococcoidia bacterium]MYA54546.1 nitroreductase family deazaflavin-dependent oxidoreductase [Dehalococcoidia bacterium]
MLFDILTRLSLLRPAESFLVRFVGWSVVSSHISRQSGVPYVPTAMLTTIGRTSGDLRSVPLFFFRDGSDFVLIGSKGGAPAHPSWFPNLVANPQAWLRVNTRRIPVTAEVVEGEDRERLWQIAAAAYPPYTEYQERANPRQIPVVRLRRR